MSLTQDNSSSQPMMSGAAAVARVIAAQDNPVVYGMPGGYTAFIFDALHDVKDRVATHLVRQESIATVMAEAHGRMTGSPAFVLAQGAWVLGNGSIGVMEAHLGASPMVILIDATDGGSFAHQGPYQGGLGSYGSYDLPAAMKAITKQTYVATDPTQALQMTQLAIKHATTGEPGPVAVIFNATALAGFPKPGVEPQAFLDRDYASVAAPIASEVAITNAAGLIAEAQQPVIVAGNGVRLGKAEEQLLNFAKVLDIPVATTPAGKGVFPENHPLAVGVIGGFGHDAANNAVGQADLVIALGTKLGASDTANGNPALIDPKRQKMIQVDVEPLNLSWTFPVDVSLQGDLLDALPRLVSALPEYHGGGTRRAKEAREGTAYFERPFLDSSEPLSARDVVRVMSETLPEETVVTCDAGENRLFVLRDFQSKVGGTVLQPNGGGGMGYAVPSAMAVAMDFPEKKAVAVCGDGGISMSLHSLVSAVELGLTMTVVVLDNGVLGWVHSGQEEDRIMASELQEFDYSAIAASIGCNAVTVETLDRFKESLVEASAREGVSLIVAKTTKDDRYQDVLASINTVDMYHMATFKRA